MIVKKIYPYEKILSAERKGIKLDITSAVLYYEKDNLVICKDRNCKKIVKQLKKDSSYKDEYFSLYLDHNKDKLVNYTYHFEMKDDGFFYYVGYDMTNY